jgi:hypothetical protein
MGEEHKRRGCVVEAASEGGHCRCFIAWFLTQRGVMETGGISWINCEHIHTYKHTNAAVQPCIPFSEIVSLSADLFLSHIAADKELGKSLDSIITWIAATIAAYDICLARSGTLLAANAFTGFIGTTVETENVCVFLCVFESRGVVSKVPKCWK